MRLAAMAALALTSAACGQSDSDNVMAPSGNALSPAQVDAALGPEVSNTEVTEPEPANAADTAAPYRPVNAAETPPAQSTPEEAPPEDAPDDAITDNESVEE